jgi:hypothetical protein
MRALDLWLAKHWPWWRKKFNAREEAKCAKDLLMYGQSFCFNDEFGRTIHAHPKDVFT